MTEVFNAETWQKFLADYEDTHIWHEDFSGCVFEDCIFDSTVRFERCKFRGAQFRGVVFDGNTIKDCTFAQSVFVDCVMKNVTAETVMFSVADLGNTKVFGGNFSHCDFFSTKSEKVVGAGEIVFSKCELRDGKIPFGLAFSGLRKKGFQPGQVFVRSADGNLLAGKIPTQRQFLQSKSLQTDFLHDVPGVLGLVETCSTFVFISSLEEQKEDFLLGDSGKEYYIPFAINLSGVDDFLKYYEPIPD